MAKKIEAPQVATPQMKGEIVDIDAPTVRAAALHRIRPNDPFYLAVHPQRWRIEFDDKKNPRLIPNCGTLVFKLGVENCTKDTKAATARANWAARGWTVLEQKLGYLRKIQVEAGEAYITVFDRTYPGSDRMTLDVAAFA